jgi:dihydrofolate synthase/folylpolyglutamate synthase
LDALEAALDRLTHLHPKRIDLSLDRVEALLAALGDPHRRLPPVIHVAGTNGKGSTVAFLRAFLEAAGLTVHVYTSPHLVRFNERIRVAGGIVGTSALVRLLERVERAIGTNPITFFEATTAAAFLAFAETPADVLLLEVGLGGRLDATNVVERPAATVITRISYDHPQFLGTDIAGIAREKAGIARPGVPLVVGPQADPLVIETIRAHAAAVGAKASFHGVDWSVAPRAAGFRLTTEEGVRDYPAPALPGSHQRVNAATAIRALDLSGIGVPDEAIRRGLATVEWPARLQRLRHGPLVEAAPPGWEVWLDGGHNDSAGEVLADWLATLPPAPLHIVCGMIETKTPVDFLGPLARFGGVLRAVAIPGEQASLPAEAIAGHARAAGFGDVATAPDLATAVRDAPGSVTGRILICGSLYLAGRVLAENG